MSHFHKIETGDDTVPTEDDSSMGSSGYVSADDSWEDDTNGSHGFKSDSLDPEEIKKQLNKGLVLGCRHDMIEIIQILLKHLRIYNGPIDAIFGEQLQRAFSELHFKTGLEDNSVIDLQTINAILTELEKENFSYDQLRQKVSEELGLSLKQCIMLMKRASDRETNSINFDANTPESTPTVRTSKKHKKPVPPVLPPAPVYQELCYQTPSGYQAHWTYFSQVHFPTSADQSSVTLVIISKDMQGSDAEKQQLQRYEKNVKESLVNSFMDFLVVMENTYSMITYINQLPGLVHFILVDRTDNRVYAPAITTMFGSKSHLWGNKKANKDVLQILKKSIWDCCYQSQEFLARGYFTMVMKCGHFQYYYNLWFETESGYPIKITSPFGWDPKKPLNQQFYKHIHNKIQEENDAAVKCYEIYALYLKFLPLKMVEQHSQMLISMLVGKEPPKR